MSHLYQHFINILSRNLSLSISFCHARLVVLKEDLRADTLQETLSFSKSIGIILLCCLYSTHGYAQPFPVSVNTQLTTPSLPYLADYVREKPQSIRTILLLNDDSRLNYEVLLKIRISGQGIELASRADYFSAPINLMFNVPEILTGFELADLFDPNNLDISGMSKSEFLKTGQLPEGIYTICFEAYDINRFAELPVSNGGCAVASVIEHEPPYLIQPIDLTPYTEPTILPFNWHPGHTIGFLTEYRLYLYEEIPGWTQDQIILYQAPLYTTEVPTTTYLYSAIDPLLERGASYFWRVQAYDPSGFELFKNNGFSQLAKFTYGQDCDAPLGLQALTVNSSSQLIRWVDSSPGTYELRYRLEEVILNTNPSSSDSTDTINNSPSPVGSIKGKKSTSPLGVNTQGSVSTSVTPTNIDQFRYSDYWTTVSNITEQAYLLNNLNTLRYEIQVRRICGSGNLSPWSVALEIDNRKPEGPEFLIPPKATEPTEVTATLFTANWDYQAEAYFELQIARDTGFAILLPGYENLMVTDLLQPIEGLVSGQTYYYRVKAKRGDLTSGWSNVQTVQTESNSIINLPALLALPAQPTSYDGFTAHWTGTTMVQIYHLEVARDREFTQPLSGYENGAQQITSGINQLPISIDLLIQGAYYRIHSSGIGGIGYSNIIEVPRQYLPIPVALEPTDINAKGFTANWESLPQATEYIIDVSTHSDFSEVIPALSNRVVVGTSISFTEYLDPENTTYFYQVRAKIAGRTSGNSNPIVVNDGGLAVVPVTEPATQIKKISFWANWKKMSSINTYALDVATSPDFLPGSFVAGFENKIVYGESHKVDPVNFASTQYFYRVRAVENEVYSIYSNHQTVRWEGCYFGPMAMDYSCGIPADPYFNEGLPMIAQLEKGDTIQAGDFLVVLNQVNNSSPFSGTGYIAMPFQQLRLNLEFTNIKVDETCRMVDGRMEVTGAGLALVSEEIASKINKIMDVLDEIDNTLSSVEEVLNQISEILTASESVGGYFTNGLILMNGVDPIFDEYPHLPPSTVDSLRMAIDCLKNSITPKTCKDNLVQSLQVLQNGLVDHYNSSQQIFFQASKDQVFGFDSIVHPAFAEHYQGITIAEKPYQIAWKSVENGSTDVVEARTENGLPFPTNIRFEDTDKNEIPTVINGNIARLTITGIGDQVAYPIYAVETIGDTVKLAGKLNIVSYNPKPIQLVIVPVNGVTYPFSKDSLTAKLKAIYQPAVADLSIRVADNFQVENFDGELDAIATGFAKSYTAEMKDIFQAYEDSQINGLDEDTYYIFLLPRFAEPNQLGYMPRKRSFGFVNHEQLSLAEGRYVKTLAHELAHGAFVLHHTFVQHPQLVDNPTENLLDNSAMGTILHQYQWAAVHDPSRAWGLFDEDEERGNYTAKSTYFTEYGFGLNKDSSFNFITPAWQYINLPKTTKDVTVYFGIYAFTHDDPRLEQELMKIPGTLASFMIDSITYNGKFTSHGDAHYFNGYFSDLGLPFVSNEQEPYSENQIIWGSEKTAYDFILHQESLTPYSFDQPIKEVHQVGPIEIMDIKSFPYSKNDSKFSFSQMTLTEATVNKVFNNSLSNDGSFLVRNKLAEIRVGYETVFDVSTDVFGEWDCDNMKYRMAEDLAGLNFLFNDINYDRQYKDNYCTCDPNPSGNNSAYSRCVNKDEAVLPEKNEKFIQHYQFLKQFLLSGFLSEMHTLKDYEVEAGLLDNVNSGRDFTELITAINLASINDFDLISEATVFKIISKLLTISVYESVDFTNDTEGAIVKIFESIPKSQYHDFLRHLDKYKNFYQQDKLVINQLFSSVDDSMFSIGQNNLNKLIKALIKIIGNCPDFYEEKLTALTNLSSDEMIKNSFTIEYQNIFVRGLVSIFNESLYATGGLYQCFDNDFSTEEFLQYYDIIVTVENDGKYTINQIIKEGINIWNDYPSEKVVYHKNPLDLLYFKNKTNLSLLKDIGSKDYMPLPAIVLRYTDQTTRSETISQAAGVIMDGLSIPAGVGILKKANGLRRAFAVLDLVSSTSGIFSVAISDLDIISQESKNYINLLSAVTGVLSMGEIGVAEMDKSMNLFKGGSNGFPLAKAAEEVITGTKTNPGAFAELFDKIPTSLEKLNASFLKGFSNAKMQGDLALAGKFQEAILEMRNVIKLDALAKFSNFSIPQVTKEWFRRMYNKGDLDLKFIPDENGGKINALYRHEDEYFKIAEINNEGITALNNGTAPTNVTVANIKNTNRNGSKAVSCENGCNLLDGCFVAGTLVHLANSKKPIEEIKAGEKIYSFDQTSGQWVISTVKEPLTRTGKEFVRLYTASDSLLSTSNHPYYLPARKEYVQAISLRKGMTLHPIRGEPIVIDSVAVIAMELPVYNLEVAVHHNFFVGNTGILVHNDCLVDMVGVPTGLLNPVNRTKLNGELIANGVGNNPLFDWLKNAEGAEKINRAKTWKLFNQSSADLTNKLGPENFRKLRSWVARNWDEIGDEAKVQTLLNRLDLTTSSSQPKKYLAFLEDFDQADDPFRLWILGGQGAERINIWKACSKDPLKAIDDKWLKQLLAASGTSKIDNVNPPGVSWGENITGHGSLTTAIDFWNDVSKNYLYYTKGDYIFKYDFATGNLLFGKASTNEILGFYEGAENLGNFIYKTSPDNLMANMKRYHGRSGPSSPIFNVPYNPQIASTPGKTTSIIGRLKFEDFFSGDMRTVVDVLISNIKSLDFGPNIGGFKLLNISRELCKKGTFWERFNKPWLLAAIKRKDIFVAASDPMNLNNIFRNWDELKKTTLFKNKKLETPEEIYIFLKKLKDREIIEKQMTFYGREIKLLSEHNYIFNKNTKKFEIL